MRLIFIYSKYKCLYKDRFLDCTLKRKNKITKSEYEVFIHKLTSNSKKLPLMEDIDKAVEMSFYEKQCDILITHLSKKLQEKPKKWFKIYKALLVSDICL